MSRFIQKALEKFPKLENTQLQMLVQQIAVDNEIMESALNSLAHGLVVVDPFYRILFINKPAERLLPWNSLENQTQEVWEKILDSEISEFLKMSLTSEQNVKNEEFIIGPDSRVRFLSLSTFPLVKDGKIQGTLIQIEEISDKKNKELRLRRAESLASLTTLAAGVAHEIKNPLGSIGIHIQLIQKAINTSTPVKPQSILKYLDVVNEELERLNGIVVDFLFAVRPMDIHLVKGHINNLVTELAEFLQYELNDAGIEIKMELEKSDDTVFMDERFLKQAVLNIMKNSMYAMPEGGTIKISTLLGKDDFRLMISDTGEGIPEENLEKIFEPYFTTRANGSGLGLTLVYKIVKEHGAEIQVHSRQGTGTTITLIFPLPAPSIQKLITGSNVL